LKKTKQKERKYVKNDNYEKKIKIKKTKKNMGKAKARLSVSSILKK
jgi:hypothetical protein